MDILFEIVWNLLLGTIRPLRYVVSKSFRDEFRECVGSDNRFLIYLSLIKEWIYILSAVLFIWFFIWLAYGR